MDLEKFFEQFEFSKEEQGLLNKNLDFYYGLYRGTREPVTEAQKDFVQIIQYLRHPKTDHELVFMKFLEHLQRPDALLTRVLIDPTKMVQNEHLTNMDGDEEAVDQTPGYYSDPVGPDGTLRTEWWAYREESAQAKESDQLDYSTPTERYDENE